MDNEKISGAVAEAPGTPEPSGQPEKKLPEKKEMPKKNRKKKLKKKQIVGIVIAGIVVLGILLGMIALFHDKEPEQQLWTDVVQRGSISTAVTGSGVTTPKDMKTITLTASGTVLEVFVEEGQHVEKGDPLYTIDSSDAQDALKNAQDVVDDYILQVDDAAEERANLNVVAPYGGRLLDTADLDVGDDASSGTKIATLVDDSRMKLTLYFSYAYQDLIQAGQLAVVSVPSTMSQFTGRVDAVHYVQFISPEGGMFFEVDLSVENPGTFTEGTVASAELVDSVGNPIYPYSGAKMEYYRKTDINLKASGEVLVNNLRDYQRVEKGALLMRLGDDNIAKRLASLQTSLRKAQEELTKAQERMDNFNAVAPMSGTVLQCPLTAGTTVESGQVAVSIADTSVMTVDAKIDERSISFVKAGVMCDITQYGRDGEQHFTGIVDTVSLEGKYENGASYFPAKILVDNPDGNILSGMNVDYNIAASQSDDCLLVPVQAVKYTEQGTCLFVNPGSRPDNALDASALGIEVPEGFYAVPVEVGLSNNTSAEIISGVEEGTEVYVQVMTQQGNSYGW